MSEWLIVLAVLIVGVLFLVYQANKEPSFNPPPQKPKPDPIAITYAELRKFDGISDPKLYLALKGVIYDVSSS